MESITPRTANSAWVVTGLRYTQADFLDWNESAVSIVAEGDYVVARLISGGA